MADKKTVRVKMLTSIAGAPLPEYDMPREFSLLFGQEHSIHPELAKKWVDCGHCELVKEPAK